MINLLPPQEKQKLILEKKRKVVVILGIIVIVSLVCLVFILTSIKFYILAETDAQKNILSEIIKRDQTSDIVSFNNIIKNYNKILSQVDSFYSKNKYFNKILKTITDIPKAQGLYITDLSLERDKNGLIKASISGVSNTRENLLNFKSNIQQNQDIKSFYFSPNSWINSKNAEFNLTIEFSI